MVKIWVVTTGSSDVQLATDDFWNDWYRGPGVKSACYDLPVEKIKPKQVIPDSDEFYRVAPRLLGQVYDAQPEHVWECLRFPLLDAFTARIRDEGVNQIVLLLTDQDLVFKEADRDDVRCPYWQDTGALLSVFERYFATHFAGVELTVLPLQPQTLEQGLDDWNEVLTLVRTALGKIEVEPEVVYVSHQAGTPAISSAVQFVSLSRFRSDVQFLVSNEYCAGQTKLIGRSTYLRGIQLQEAKALLKRYDYSGIKVLLGTTGRDNVDQLLETAIFWNLAQFDNFSQKLKESSNPKISNAKIRDEANWWLPAYEAAYLGIIRLEQENVHEAMFHSFRALEGLAKKFCIESNLDSGTLCGVNLFGKVEGQIKDKWAEHPYIKELILVNSYRPKKSNNENIDDLVNHRNNLFHNFSGITKKNLFDAWKVNNLREWNEVVCSCLNFISGQSFSTLEEASIMPTVHKELETAIASLAQPPG
jgi:hypothetical protein